MQYQTQRCFFTNTGKFGKFVDGVFKQGGGELHGGKGTRNKGQGASRVMQKDIIIYRIFLFRRSLKVILNSFMKY